LLDFLARQRAVDRARRLCPGGGLHHGFGAAVDPGAVRGPLDRARIVMAELVPITPDDDGIRIDRWFKRHYPGLPHTKLEKLLRRGEVRLDGKRAAAAPRIATGQTLRLPPQIRHDNIPAPAKTEAAKPMGSLEDTILYMDKNLFVLNKPPGLATQGG